MNNETIEKKKKVGAPVKHTFETLAPIVEKWLDYAKNQTFEKVIFDQKTGEQKSINLKKPMTIQSFILYANITRQTFLDIMNDKEYNVYDKLLVDMFTRVHETIQENQISGAILNEYNANIVSRINGLNDTVNIESNVQPIVNIALPGMNANFGTLQENNIQDIPFEELPAIELNELN